jgi:hypothetical protein
MVVESELFFIIFHLLTDNAAFSFPCGFAKADNASASDSSPSSSALTAGSSLAIGNQCCKSETSED